MLDKLFFTVDSNNLKEVEDCFLGFSVNKASDSVYKDDQEFYPTGAFIEIHKTDRLILIHPDITGNFRLFLYRKDDYFMLGNSLCLMAEKLSDMAEQGYTLSLNRRYAAVLMGIELANFAYTKTIFNEIELIPKGFYVSINIKDRILSVKKIKTEPELSIPLDSEDAFVVLDKWHSKWCSIFSLIRNITDNISIDLSGGFDSRLVLALILSSGIDLKNIRINSATDGLHTHAEDYAIAREIASHFNLSLNKRLKLSQQNIPYAFDRIISSVFCSKIFEHKEFYFKYDWSPDCKFVIGGKGGESFRGHWVKDPKEFVRSREEKASAKSWTLAEPVRLFLSETISKVKKDCGIKNLDQKFLMLLVYRNTRLRSHFGSDVVENLLANSLLLSPLLDADLFKLCLNCRECSDPNLLFAIIFKRYCPELLNFKFDSGRKFNQDTLDYAEYLSAKYPRKAVKSGNYTLRIQNDAPGPSGFSVERVKKQDLEEYIKNLFLSAPFRSVFCQNFSQELYGWIKEDLKTRKYFPLTNVNSAVATVIAASYCMNSALRSCGIPVDFVNSKLNVNSEGCQHNPNPCFADNNILARIDIKNSGADSNNVEILNVSDRDLKISSPFWFSGNGTGHIVTSGTGNLACKLRCVGDGRLQIWLRGNYLRDDDNHVIPRWVYYKSFLVNGRPQFFSIRPVWHDKPFVFTKDVTDGEIVELKVDWITCDSPALKSVHSEGTKSFIAPPLAITKKIFLLDSLSSSLKQIPALIEIRNTGPDKNELSVSKISDPNVRILCRNCSGGSGVDITSYEGRLEALLSCRGGGQLVINLRCLDFGKTTAGRDFPVVTYTGLSLGKERLFRRWRKVRPDRPYRVVRAVEDGDEIKLSVSWISQPQLQKNSLRVGCGRLNYSVKRKIRLTVKKFREKLSMFLTGYIR